MSYAGATKAAIPGGELVTLNIALVICLAMAKEDLRNAVHAQLCPRWRRALDAHPIETKPMFTGGRLVHKRALPTAVAMQLLQEWIPDAIHSMPNNFGTGQRSPIPFWVHLFVQNYFLPPQHQP
jgi:hypothetical protein